MISQAFREFHLLAILTGYEQQNLPLDLYVSHYFRANKALGSKDRGFIVENLYALIRWKGLLNYLTQDNFDWQKRWQAFTELDLARVQEDDSIPWHIRVSFPEELFRLFVNSYGLEQAISLCLASNQPAPTTVRANALKTSRAKLLEQWQNRFDVSPCHQAPCGIIFHKKINFFDLPEFKQGLFEVQDEASQLLAGLVQATPHDLVLDYCSGSGGKTLAFAPAMQNQGQIFLHDVRPRVLLECRKRLKRAGIQNAQIVNGENDPKLKKLKKKCDWVLVDAPCSGTGTLRRNPDMKWKIDTATVQRLVGVQRNIFEKALSYLHPEGKIVYATCSLLKEENQDQLDHFMATYHLEMAGEIFQSLPATGKGDGFFGAVLKRKA